MPRSADFGPRLNTDPKKAQSDAHRPCVESDSDQSECLAFTAKLVEQIETMIAESGDPEGFDAALWVDEWVNKPLPALGGRAPCELIGSAEGRAWLSRLLATAQSGTYS